ncbi:hypothetical protein M885DRAFT_505971 [Pelagophyceae sp. CCMP2097]|nr:hypothetical protein M885DRAFT_505971 [Pelagophyceae sp. CCMP2097]
MFKVFTLVAALRWTSAAALRRGRFSALAVRGGSDDNGTEVDSLFGGDDNGLGSDLSDVMAGFDGMGLPAGMTPENMGEYAKMMEGFMDSPMMQEFLSDPEKMEQTRMALLKSPMAAQMMQSVPGFEEIINNKELWHERMLESKQQFDLLRKQKQEAAAKEQAAADDFED